MTDVMATCQAADDPAWEDRIRLRRHPRDQANGFVPLRRHFEASIPSEALRHHRELPLS